MFPWKYSTIHTPEVLPRQFEYHPRYQDVILYGTQDAKVGVMSTESKSVNPIGVFGKDQFDPILGLCWFRHNDAKFVCGSSFGLLKCGHFTPDGDNSFATPMTHSYGLFPHLSSVHINSIDSHLLVSGTSHNVNIYDLNTGQQLVSMQNCHSDSINISRFANHSPNLFATCSFDSTIKFWDLRMAQADRHIQSMKTDTAIVMINFSPNDSMVLSAGSDNEVHQYLVANGHKHMTYNVPKRYSAVNFTRAYYSSSGEYIATGGSEEDCINLLSTSTGGLLCNVPLFPDTAFPSPYVQSLRLCPNSDRLMTILVNDRVLGQRQLVHIEITSDYESKSCADCPNILCPDVESLNSALLR